jgi:hypothetical protein
MSDPAAWDWGSVTVDIYSADRRTAIHVISAALAHRDLAIKVIRYCRGRYRWCLKHLPKGTRQVFLFDVRGQLIPEDVREQIRIFGQECPVQIRER